MNKEEVLLLSVEDLIHRSIGNAGQNSGHVDFKGIQTILHLLARQMRMLEQKVEIQVEDFEPDTAADEFGFSADDTSTEGSQVKKKQGTKMEQGKRKPSQDKAKRKPQENILESSLDRSETEEDQAEDDPREDNHSEDNEGGELTLKTSTSSEKRRLRQLEKMYNNSKEKGIVVTEKSTKDDKILIVERKRSVSGTASGIEVVTRSQFELLVAAVRDLQAMAGPAPAPTLPENQQLRRDMQEGKASLADTMNAMNVNARVEAAESALERLSSLVTQLTQATGIPENFLKMTDDVHRLYPAESARVSRVVPSSRPASISVGSTPHYVMHEEMEIQFQSTRDYLLKALNVACQRSTDLADNAFLTVRSMGEKMDIAEHLNQRVMSLYSKVSDYAEQLKGFDSGIGIQLQSFQDQMIQMAEDLKTGLDLMERTHHNAENAAIIELTERYEGLLLELEQMLSAHQQLCGNQERLDIEIKSLVEWVEMLRDQKADRDEVQDALRDKADLSRLEGLLSEDTFTDMKLDLENRLQVCYDKFSQQEEVWMLALKELGAENETKADNIQLYMARDEAQRALQALHDLATRLEQQLGEPKAAILLRQICKSGVCAACMHPAIISPTGEQSAHLPALTREHHVAADGDQPRVPLIGHRCNRWVGGSHTLLVPERVRRVRASPMQLDTRANKYFGYGEDGQLYYMEETCAPCVECNPPPNERGTTTPQLPEHTCTPKPMPLSKEEIILDKENANKTEKK